MLSTFQSALGTSPRSQEITLTDGDSLSSIFAVSDLAQASIGAAAGALASLIASMNSARPPRVTVDRDLASAWFATSLRPQGWELPSPWDSLAGDYVTRDGWIKIHTNASHHRARAVEVLDCGDDRDNFAAAVSGWNCEELETAIVTAGGAAAALRSSDEWRGHPQGRALTREPLLWSERGTTNHATAVFGSAERPLSGLKVLDLTRVVAEPVATRLLAGWGANVLRIDAPDWDEPGLAPEMTLGKRCARLDLHDAVDRERFTELLSQADVVVSGYRSDALERLGFGVDVRDQIRPGLVDVSLDAYGWTGPWATRRGFDSLVQMSTGICDAGRRAARVDHPVSLPVQALDHATGYLMAAAAITGVRQRLENNLGSRWRTSLASMANVLIAAQMLERSESTDSDQVQPVLSDQIESTPWGDARRLRPPVVVVGAPLHWDVPARRLGNDSPTWL